MFEIAKPFLLSIALGLAIGIERERSHKGAEPEYALGSRTFTLVALLGTLAAHVGNPGIAAVLGLFVAGLIVATYLRGHREANGGLGATTEVAAMATFGVGWLAHGEPRLAAMVGVGVLAILWLRPKIHAFAHEGLSDTEVNSALLFLVIALVVLPLLPDRAVDPWGLFNPARLWLIFTLMCGVGFAGYIAVRAMGPARGLAAGGFAAGLVSSTAVTLSYSRRARDHGDAAGPLATGIVLANVASALSVLLVVAVANRDLLPKASVLMGAPIGVGLLGTAAAIWWLRRNETHRPQAPLQLSNPLELRSALILAVVLAAILTVSELARRWLGPSGVVATAALAGSTDVQSATLAAATILANGSITVEVALLAILLAYLGNMALKLGIVAVVGGRSLLLPTAPPLVGMAAAAVAAYFAIR